MQISLRIANVDLGTVINIVFRPQKPFRMRLFPLPPTEWVGEQKCNCGENPDFLTEDMRPICKKCIDTIMRGVVINKIKHEEPSIPITLEIIGNSRFEWSIDGDKWYSIKGKNIKTEQSDLFMQNLKKSIIEKRPMVAEADYDKDKKELTITL